MRSVLSAFVATTFVTAQKGCSDNLGTNKCKNMTEKCSNWYFSNYMCPVSCGKCEKGIYDWIYSALTKFKNIKKIFLI